MVGRFGMLALCLGLIGLLEGPAIAQQKSEASNMELVGYNNLQGREAYQPTIIRQGDRWIAYIGAEDGAPPRLNSLTGKVEPSGTSVLDVTDPKHPKFIANIPGEMVKASQVTIPGESGEKEVPTGAQFVRACNGSDLPHGDKTKSYMLRSFGKTAFELWDVTDPAKPNRINVIVGGLRNTNKPWWECNTGIAYLPGGPLDWGTTAKGNDQWNAGSHALIYDLSDPAKPVFIRSFGLPGQQPGSGSPVPISSLHWVLSTGPKGNRVYFAYGNAGNGIVEIVDRDKLLNGPKEPTDGNLRSPVIARIDFPASIGAHTIFPLMQMKLPEFSKQKNGQVQSFFALTGQGHGSNRECQEWRQMFRVFDITDESKPVGVATWTVPEASQGFCSVGGVFGAHSTNENFTPIYYERVLFLTFHNAGVRALDIRDPYHPKEIGSYIPAVTETTQPSCMGKGADRHCKTVTDTNNVEVDDRGYIYIVDIAGTGMHILKLTGSARPVADFTRAEDLAGSAN
jgi:hypothetical protein